MSLNLLFGGGFKCNKNVEKTGLSPPPQAYRLIHPSRFTECLFFFELCVCVCVCVCVCMCVHIRNINAILCPAGWLNQAVQGLAFCFNFTHESMGFM